MSELLAQAKSLIAAPGNWTQNVLAIDDAGSACDPRTRFARCFCAQGAVIHVLDLQALPTYTESTEAYAHSPFLRAVLQALDEGARRHINNADLEHDVDPGVDEVHVELNDGERTMHSDVLEMFTEAIAFASEQGQ